MVTVASRKPAAKRLDYCLRDSCRHLVIALSSCPFCTRYVALKTLASMQWASENLPPSFYFSSGDDDFFVRVDRLFSVIEEARRNVTRFRWPTFPMICTYRLLKVNEPYRKRDGTSRKWYISEEEYKWPYYPRSCLGGHYSTSVDVVKQLFQIAETTPYLRVDDVWITGVLRTKLGMPDEMVVLRRYQVVLHGVGHTAQEILDYNSIRRKKTTWASPICAALAYSTRAFCAWAWIVVSRTVAGSWWSFYVFIDLQPGRDAGPPKHGSPSKVWQLDPRRGQKGIAANSKFPELTIAGPLRKRCISHRDIITRDITFRIPVTLLLLRFGRNERIFEVPRQTQVRYRCLRNIELDAWLVFCATVTLPRWICNMVDNARDRAFLITAEHSGRTPIIFFGTRNPTWRHLYCNGATVHMYLSCSAASTELIKNVLVKTHGHAATFVWKNKSTGMCSFANPRKYTQNNGLVRASLKQARSQVSRFGG